MNGEVPKILGRQTSVPNALRKNGRLLDEAEAVNLFLLCASIYLLKRLEKSFPGLSALLAARLRLLGLNPYEALAADAKKFSDVLARLFGGPELAYRYLRAVLPRDSMFEELLGVLFRGNGASEVEEALINVARKYQKHARNLCEAAGS